MSMFNGVIIMITTIATVHPIHLIPADLVQSIHQTNQLDLRAHLQATVHIQHCWWFQIQPNCVNSGGGNKATVSGSAKF